MEVGIAEGGSMEIGSIEIGSAEVGTAKIGAAEVGSTEISTTEVGSTEISIAEFGSKQANNRLIFVKKPGLVQELEYAPFSFTIQARKHSQRPYPGNPLRLITI